MTLAYGLVLLYCIIQGVALVFGIKFIGKIMSKRKLDNTLLLLIVSILVCGSSLYLITTQNATIMWLPLAISIITAAQQISEMNNARMQK